MPSVSKYPGLASRRSQGKAASSCPGSARSPTVFEGESGSRDTNPAAVTCGSAASARSTSSAKRACDAGVGCRSRASGRSTASTPAPRKPGIDGLHRPVAPEQEPGPEQQEERQTDLEAEEHRPETASGPALGPGAPALLDLLGGVHRLKTGEHRQRDRGRRGPRAARARPPGRRAQAAASPDACGLAVTSSGAAQAARPTATAPATSGDAAPPPAGRGATASGGSPRAPPAPRARGCGASGE